MNDRDIQTEIEKRVQKKLAPLFQNYKSDFTSLQSILKGNSIVLIIGNYSSGKSTFINELIGRDIQRTGQAPTDDSFTIITSDGEDESDVPGATIVRDQNLPYTKFEDFGKKFISHFTMKKINEPFLENMTIIDSPGMLDAESEKDRGYNYLKVVGEFAKIADLIVLMFDLQKPGTIKETYTTIRDTLPESSTEDRIIFAMNRIDECDNLSDLVRSYGTLCWNLSQMTGRKDIPRIFLTYSPQKNTYKLNLGDFREERGELEDRVLKAPVFRLNHILEDIGQKVNELKMIAEVMANVCDKCRLAFRKTYLVGSIIAVFAFLFTDLIIRSMFSIQMDTMIEAIMGGSVEPSDFLIPLISFVVVLSITILKFHSSLIKWKKMPDNIILLDTEHRKQIWERVKVRVENELKTIRLRDVLFSYHKRNLNKINKFLDKDLSEFYERIKTN